MPSPAEELDVDGVKVRLQDPDLTKVIIITLAETTPVLERLGLQDERDRASIHPWAVAGSISTNFGGASWRRLHVDLGAVVPERQHRHWTAPDS